MAARPARSENDMISMINEMAEIIEKLTAQLDDKDNQIENLKRTLEIKEQKHQQTISRLVRESGVESRGEDRCDAAGEARALPSSATVFRTAPVHNGAARDGAARDGAVRGLEAPSSGGPDPDRGGSARAPSSSATVFRTALVRDNAARSIASRGLEAPSSGGPSSSANNVRFREVVSTTMIPNGARASDGSDGSGSRAPSNSATVLRVDGAAVADGTHDGRGGKAPSSSATVLRAARSVLFDDGHREARAFDSPHAYTTNGSNEKPLAVQEAHTKATMRRILTSAGAPRCNSD